MTSNIITNYKNQILYTRLTGKLTIRLIDQWESSLYLTAKEIPDNSAFKFLIDESGYEFDDTSIQAAKKKVLPNFLASYGFIFSFLGSKETDTLIKTVAMNERGVSCIAMAMNHHNKDVMKTMQEQFGSKKEAYFSDVDVARAWIEST